MKDIMVYLAIGILGLSLFSFSLWVIQKWLTSLSTNFEMILNAAIKPLSEDMRDAKISAKEISKAIVEEREERLKCKFDSSQTYAKQKDLEALENKVDSHLKESRLQ